MELLKSDYGSLKPLTQIFLLLGSFLIVAFGQPAWVPPLGLVAGVCGYALLWRVLFCWRSRRFRFLVATVWFTAAQMIQLSWMTADEYQGPYIFVVWLLLAGAVGVQFGALSLVVRRGSLKSIGRVAAISFLWVLMEWSRLFVLSGFTWNPVGLALTASLYGMQMAAIGGVFLLSFWLFFTNLLVLRAWALSDAFRPIGIALLAAATPYLFGAAHLAYHAGKGQETTEVLLVQPAQPPRVHATLPALTQWELIFSYVADHEGEQIDLMVMPEAMVPYGTYEPAYRLHEVHEALKRNFANLRMPKLEEPLARKRDNRWLVSNAYIAKAVALTMEADLLVGMEDGEEITAGTWNAYNAAFFFEKGEEVIRRYEKRILVPMGEYIPFEWARSIAATYGITGSFTAGTEAKVFQGEATPPFAPSICYEETYGNLMRESRQKGAELLVNVTNDVWYPNSRLPKQHFDHSRLRAVENGVPMVRACNTGVTGGVDANGRIIGLFGDEWEAGALLISMPTYHYQTLYSRLGDGLVIGLAFIFSITAIRFRALVFS